MRFLKMKVQLYKDLIDELSDVSDEDQTEASSSKLSVDLSSPSEAQEKPRIKTVTKENSKNIVKNYGKALCAFASSPIAIYYLETIIKKYSYTFVKLAAFMEYIRGKKEGINSINSLRRLLVVGKNENKEMAAYKHIFQEVSIIFLKYFAVNWIFNGKLVQKKIHLDFRFKMLRRVQNPKLFTYLKASK